MNQGKEKDISVEQFKIVIKGYWKYFFSKRKWIFLAGLLSGLIGITYAWLQKPEYTAALTFAAENDNDSKLGSYAGLAASFGFDLSSGGGTVFEGENLMELLKSRLLVERTLMTPVIVKNEHVLLVNYFIKANKIDKNWSKDTALRTIRFYAEQPLEVRVRDSVMKSFCKEIIDKALHIDKPDKKLTIISVEMKDHDELFAKMFVEQLCNNAIHYYVDYKVKKSLQNVQILQHQTDSVKNLLTGNIVAVAVSSDLNVNPIRQMGKANVQRKQVDVQVNGQVYGELLKQLEFAKITLRKETPLIQIIDTPKLPLDKKKLGRLMGGLIFSFIGSFLMIAWFFMKKLFT